MMKFSEKVYGNNNKMYKEAFCLLLMESATQVPRKSSWCIENLKIPIQHLISTTSNLVHTADTDTALSVSDTAMGLKILEEFFEELY